jgi:ABC-type uncharacterized transport system fused permease/ATPase subunit
LGLAFVRGLRDLTGRLLYSTNCLLLVLLISLLVASEVLNFFIGQIPGEFVGSILSFSRSDFKFGMWKAIVLVVAKALVLGGEKMSSALFQLQSRKILTMNLQRDLLQSPLRFYEIIYGCSKIDNPYKTS